MGCVVPLTPDHRQGVLDLFGEIFGAAKSKQLAERFDWQYQDSPALRPGQPSNWILIAEGRVVGHLGLVMVAVKAADTSHLGCWGTDLMVHPDHRHRKSVGELLSILDRASGIPMGFGMADVVGRIYKRRGYIRHQIGSHLIRFCTTAGAVRLAGGLETGPSRAVRLATIVRWKARNLLRFLHHRRNPIPEVPGGWESELSPTPPAESNELWRRVSAGFPAAVVRDQAYLRWRYCDAPGPARFLTIRLGREPVALVVLETFSWRGIRAGQISELLCSRPDAQNVVPIALHFISKVFSRQGVDALLVEGFPSDIRAQFARHGFDEVVPGRSEIHVVLNRDGRLPADVISPSDNWLLTAGDSDRSTPYPRLKWRL